VRARRKVTPESTKNHYILICARARASERETHLLPLCFFTSSPFLRAGGEPIYGFCPDAMSRAAVCFSNTQFRLSISRRCVRARRDHRSRMIYNYIYNTNFESGLPFFLALDNFLLALYYCPPRCS
jgi:hypothetical protein